MRPMHGSVFIIVRERMAAVQRRNEGDLNLVPPLQASSPPAPQPGLRASSMGRCAVLGHGPAASPHCPCGTKPFVCV